MENQGPNNNEYRNPFEPDNGENGNNNNNNDNGNNKKNRNGQTIMYFVVVISLSPIGPLAWSFWVLMPISAPKPNCPPSVNRVEALTYTAAASISFKNRCACS